MIFDKIKAICDERKISISALERMANLGNGTISGWNESSPRLDKIMAVAKVLEIPLSALVEEEVTE